MKKCNSLDEVRSEIDIIDIKLVELISERSHLIHQAAGFKNSVEEVKAEDRIEFILQRVRHKSYRTWNKSKYAFRIIYNYD